MVQEDALKSKYSLPSTSRITQLCPDSTTKGKSGCVDGEKREELFFRVFLAMGPGGSIIILG